MVFLSEGEYVQVFCLLFIHIRIVIGDLICRAEWLASH
jgi:hypothetical protein